MPGGGMGGGTRTSAGRAMTPRGGGPAGGQDSKRVLGALWCSVGLLRVPTAVTAFQCKLAGGRQVPIGDAAHFGALQTCRVAAWAAAEGTQHLQLLLRRAAARAVAAAAAALLL